MTTATVRGGLADQDLQGASQGAAGLRVSVVIPTYNRAADLEETLASVIAQTVPPLEAIIVDDSTDDSVERLVGRLSSAFAGAGVRLAYLRNPREKGNTMAKNAGAAASKGDVVLFLDDDVTLDGHFIEEVLRVYRDHPEAMGVQGYWGDSLRGDIPFRMRIPFNRVFFLYRYHKDSCAVQPSFRAVYPYPLTTVARCQWLSGCNQSYRRELFDGFQFDEKLRRYSPGDDLDFSYRIQKRYPGSLFITPSAKLVHRETRTSRTPGVNLANLQSAYLEYLFRKNVEQSLPNRLAYRWSTAGRILTTLIDDSLGMVKEGSGGFHRTRHLMGSLGLCWKHRRDLRAGDLGYLERFTDY